MFTARRTAQAIHVKRTPIWRQSGLPGKNAFQNSPTIRPQREIMLDGSNPAH